MKNPEIAEATLADFLSRSGIVAVVRRGVLAYDEPFVAILDDGRVIGFNSHVDLGTGIRTSLAQIVAEELDAELTQVSMMLGDTRWVPEQGPTVASETLQVTAIPLRHAAAQARQALLALAADHFGGEAAGLEIEAGQVFPSNRPEARRSFAELVGGQTILIELDRSHPVKSADQYRIVGRSAPRVDLPGKATGELVFVHDMRIDGMLHGRVVRPPYVGRDTGAFIGRTLRGIDRQSIAHIPGIVDVVVIHDFVGIVAEREEQAEAAMRALKVDWGPFDPLPELDELAAAIAANPRKSRTLVDTGDVDAALDGLSTRLERTYVWPYQMHASIGPCCSLATFDEEGRLTVWSSTQTHQILRMDLARLFEMPQANIEIIRMEGAGSYGRSGADDVGADAAVLARAVGRPVRVQLSREQEHGWEPKGAAQLMEIDGGINANGELAAYDFQVSYPSNIAPTLALLLTRAIEPAAAFSNGGDRTAAPPYEYRSTRLVVHDMPPIARASFLRGVAAMPNSFAHESYIDELAVEAGVDPIAYRLRNLPEPRVQDLIRATAERANWAERTQARQQTAPDDDTILRGQGFAYATYVHGVWPGKAAASAAWVAEVEVNRVTGDVAVTRVVVGQDAGLMINPDGVRHQIQGNVIQSTSRVMQEQVPFDGNGVVASDWGSYPILTFNQLPTINVVMMERPADPPLGGGESASVPSAAAIANAIYDATGVRFRELPLTPERIRAGLGIVTPALPGPVAQKPKRDPLRMLTTAVAGVAALATAGGILWPFKPAIAPIARPAADIFSAATIERGRLVAAAGNCQECHTTAGGAQNAGGLAMETPFGTVYSTNITPDEATGIGSWSYPAFERAMRLGISRDGQHLYPAFPYTAFTRLTDADLQALYAYLMAQPSIRSAAPESKLAFPYNQRALLAGWNALFLKPGPVAEDPKQSAQWNRGAYLTEGPGHCSACHTPRNALGGEATGDARWGGAMVKGWEAPALGAQARSPMPWSTDDYFDYLRGGASDRHGPAMGPMAPVVSNLSQLPDSDIRAMAVYLASLGQTASTIDPDVLAVQADQALRSAGTAGGRLYAGACAVCHAPNAPPLFGARLPLALNSNLHSDRPDNLIRAILDGVTNGNAPARGAMPAYRDVYSDVQIAELVGELRRTHAPDRAPWPDLRATAARIRADSAGGKSAPR